MSRNIIITTVAIVLVVLIAIYSRPTKTPIIIPTENTEQTGDTGRVINPDQPQPADGPTNSSTRTVIGTITEKDDGCFSDGICRINIGDTWVITNQGWYNGPLGKVDDDIKVGMTVEVYGKVTPDGITMLGSNSYYVRALSK